jgi:hypothetical protein
MIDRFHLYAVSRTVYRAFPLAEPNKDMKAIGCFN